MDSFYTREELEKIGFRELGDDVKSAGIPAYMGQKIYP